MNVELLDDVVRFLDAAAPLLLRDEARHNLMLGVAGTIRSNPEIYPERSLWLVRDGGEVVAAALRTPPYGLALAQPRDGEALATLVDAIADDLPGVTAAVPEVEDFASAWCARRGCTAHVVLGQGIYALRALAPFPRASGRMRDATREDLDLVVEWAGAFQREALPHEAPTDHHRLVELRFMRDDAGIVLWEDGGEPVSLCGYSGPTPNGIRIGPVYTPPERRGRGYGTTLTADVSARLLAEGRAFCFLYTDLANPTSNAIYERIGYVRVCESRQVAFD